jgi:mono/diheme cytochrome c family protein
LPAGSGSVAQGAQVFAQKCAVCHGANAEGTPSATGWWAAWLARHANPLKTVNSYWPYATTVFDYIRRAMPITESAIAAERRGLRARGLHSFLRQCRAERRRAGREFPAQGANAESGGFVNWEPR